MIPPILIAAAVSAAIAAGGGAVPTGAADQLACTGASLFAEDADAALRKPSACSVSKRPAVARLRVCGQALGICHQA